MIHAMCCIFVSYQKCLCLTLPHRCDDNNKWSFENCLFTRLGPSGWVSNLHKKKLHTVCFFSLSLLPYEDVARSCLPAVQDVNPYQHCISDSPACIKVRNRCLFMVICLGRVNQKQKSN